MMISQFFYDEDGQTLVEYALVISLLALVIVGAVAVFGGRAAAMWGGNASKYPDPPA